MPEINGINYPRLVNGVVEYGPAREAQSGAANQEPEAPGAIGELPDGPNLNTASATELRREIEGVGPKTAGEIIAARKEAPFQSLEDAADRIGGLSLSYLEAAGAAV